MTTAIPVYVELLDEGVDTWRATGAESLGNGLFRLLEAEGYDPEDEFWEFAPGQIVRLESATHYDGTSGLVARHPDSHAVRVRVPSNERHAPKMRDTHALPVSAGVYRLLPTPHYTSAQQWKFPPNSLVRIEYVKGDTEGYSYWLVNEKV